MATAFVNKHITRVLAAGGTVAEPTWLADVDDFLTSEGLYGNLFDWSNPAFGVVKNGSNEISKIMGLGTTWLPRLGDLTPVAPSSTTYDATAISGFPAWTNAANTAYSYYGAARDGTIRVEPIRRKHAQGFTVVAVFKKTHSNTSSMLGLGQFGGIYLQNTAGSPGACKFAVGPIGGTTFSDTHPTTIANNVVHIIGGTFDKDQVVSYVEGVAGTGTASNYRSTNSGNNQYRPLLGGANLVNQFYYALVSGSSAAKYTMSSTSTTRTLSDTVNEAAMSISDLIIFDTALTAFQMADLNTFLRTRY